MFQTYFSCCNALGILFFLLATFCLNDGATAFELPEHLANYNVVWNTSSKDSSESMPCGGGDIGLNVWVENGELLFYIQRSGSLTELNEYVKLGRVRLKLNPNPFAETASKFRQELKLRQGYVEIQGISESQSGEPIEATAHVWVEVHRPIVHVEIEASKPIEVTASYENWRLEDKVYEKAPKGRGLMGLRNIPTPLSIGKDIIEKTANGVRFYHHNPAETVIESLITQQRLEASQDEISNDLKHRTFGGEMLGDGFQHVEVTEGKYQLLNFKAWNLSSQNARTKHHLKVVTHIDQTDSIDQWKTGLESTIEASQSDLKEVRQKTRQWWQDFWGRSWIAIHPEKPDAENASWRAGRNYNLFRYQLGCNFYGEYPTKFNGGNFTFDANLVGQSGYGGIMEKKKPYGPDWRPWGGGVFTAQNQRLLYWPMLKAGDAEAIIPQVDLYRKSLPGAKARVKTHFGHDGAIFCEYIGVPGLALGDCYGWGKMRGTEIPFGDPRADATRHYKEFVEPGVMAHRSISYHWESQIEHAYMILEYHRFSGADISAYIPFIENAVFFFDEHYRLRQKIRSGKELNEEGELVLYPQTSCESYRGATNPSDLIAGLNACIDGILALDDELLVLRDKAYYRNLKTILPGYTFGEVDGDKVLEPAKSWKRYQNEECPQFYPLFPFNQFDLFVTDKDQMQLFRDTWKHGTFPKELIRSWHQDGIFFARMGMTESAKRYNTRKLDDCHRRYPTFWGPGNDWTPDHNWGGSGIIGLQEMLLQTPGDKIILFPAWPKDWDVDFKLHAPKRTTVSGKLRDGAIVDLTVIPATRKKDLVIIGPN